MRNKTRQSFLHSTRLVLLVWLIPCVNIAAAAEPPSAEPDRAYADRTMGMLVGSLIGDAVGGPVEFKSPEELNKWLPDLRAWSADEFRRRLKSGKLAQRFKLLPYADIRPNIAPYGPWEENAHPGTVTDDSRHKMVLLDCLATQVADRRSQISQVDLAKSYIHFAATQSRRGRTDYARLSDESMREYVAVAKWLLGERNLTVAHPPQRLWAGIATCSGQMTLLPLAGAYAGDANGAYRAAFALGFVDVGPAKDINSALVAGLAAAIGNQDADIQNRWSAVYDAIRNTDPYNYAQVPFAKRPATEWLDFASDAAKRANGSPKELFRILESEGRAKYFWDAHFTYASAIACLQFTEHRPLEALIVSLTFGHDTDSAAQVIGALSGAVHGTKIFPKAIQEQVKTRLRADYDEDLDEWSRVLSELNDRQRFPAPVQFVENASSD